MPFKRNRSIFKRVRSRIFKWLSVVIPLTWIYKIIYSKFDDRGFNYEGTIIPYYFHSVHHTGLTERAVELPLIEYYLRKSGCKRVLEVGNVTNHYYKLYQGLDMHKDVVDKFERGPGVINVDINKYQTEELYDLVFSISTFEHMDSDLGNNKEYVPGSSMLVSVAADNIKYVSDHLLKPGGKFILTAATGYAPEWDLTLSTNAFLTCGFSVVKMKFYKRFGELDWRVATMEECLSLPPTSYEKYRNALAVVELEK